MSESRLAPFTARGSLGGLLMGLANLVPGISGGTMLLATGVYRAFVDAVAEVTTLKFRFRSIWLLGVVGATAALVILLLAGPVASLVADHRWVMYSLFLGLTFGGVPVVWRMTRGLTAGFGAGAVAGLGVMALMALSSVSDGGSANTLLLGLAGMAGAVAMVLPGVSGAYLLLVLGQYETILGAIDRLKSGQLRDAAPVVVPVGIGVLVGIAGISNLVRWSLRRYEQATLGVLMGLLFGSVIGIYPFQAAVERGEAPVYFRPAPGQLLAALALALAGYGATRLIDRLGR